jgi:two-component system response regulator WspF
VVAEAHELAWIARDGEEAVQKALADKPELILMDLMMPKLDGVQATRQIMERCPCPILIVTASVEGTANLVFEALGAGALDAVKTPLLGFQGNAEGRDALLAKIATLARLIEPNVTAPRAPSSPRSGQSQGPMPRLVAIGASSGGPQALSRILAELPPDLPAAVLVVQHIDPEFSRGLAEWLATSSRLPVRLAEVGQRPQRGHVYVAGPGGHLVLSSTGRFSCTQDPEGIYCPSIDQLYFSIARHATAPCLGLLLTGMGADGAQGLLALKRAGHHTVVQDEASCAIFGMPRAAIRLDAAQHVVGLPDIPRTVVSQLGAARGR